MAQQNLVSFQIADKDLADIKAAIDTLKAKLLPNLKALTPTEKKELPKMGDKTTAFVQKTLEYCKSNPDLCPQYLDVAALEVDVKAVETIRNIYAPLLQIVEALDDTMTLSGSEAYSGSLMYYNSAKFGAKSNINGAKTIYEELSSRFPGKPKGTNAATAASSTTTTPTPETK
jgi:hypothetical protein